MSGRHPAGALALMLALVCLLWLLPGSGQETLAGQGRIVFQSDRDGNWELYLMNADGGGQVRLTDTPAEEWLPVWSPDGRRIAFVSDREGGWNPYVLDLAEPGRAQRLTGEPGSGSGLDNNWDPAWSPDSRRLVFMSVRDGNRELYVMNAADGSGLVRLTRNDWDDKNPAWAP